MKDDRLDHIVDRRDDRHSPESEADGSPGVFDKKQQVETRPTPDRRRADKGNHRRKEGEQGEQKNRFEPREVETKASQYSLDNGCQKRRTDNRPTDLLKLLEQLPLIPLIKRDQPGDRGEHPRTIGKKIKQ